MEQVTIYLDGIKLETLPLDITDFEEELAFDKDLFGYVLKYPLDLTFVGDGYKYLLGLKKTEGYCRRVDVLINFNPNGDPTYGKSIRGFLFISDMEHDHTKRIIRCSIEDNNFGSILKQNSKLPVDVRSIVTKNGETLTATPSFNLTVYNPSTGVDYVDPCTAYDIEDVFEHLISFLSDNEIGFQSDFLSALPDEEKLSLVRGRELRQKNDTEPQVTVSFQHLMDFLHKKYNLFFAIDNTGFTPIFRLEDEDFFSGASVVDIPFVKDLKETFDQDKLTSVIKVGSSDAIKETGTAHELPYVTAIAFVEEEYFLTGLCGIDSELDLVHDDIQYDTNLIEELVTGTSDDKDDDVFCVQYVGSTTTAHKGEYILSTPGGTPVLYNEQLLNLNVINRFKAPTDVAQILGDGTNDNFRASRTNNTALATTSPIDFDDETTPPNEDPGGNYSIVTFRYTAPASGLYSFEVGLEYEITQLEYTPSYSYLQNSLPARTDVDVYMTRRNAATTVIETRQVSNNVHTTTGAFQRTASGTFYMNSGDTLEAALTVLTGINISMTGTLLGGTESYFKTTFVFTGGGDIQIADKQNIKIINVEFERGLSNKDWNIMTSQSYNGITIDTNGVNKTVCWIDSVKRKLFTGQCDLKLVTTLAQMNLWEI
jgi:hypothetical protein